MKGKFFGAIFTFVILASGCAQSKSKSMEKKTMDALNGKEGVFAVLKLPKGEVALELYYKDTPLTVVNFVGLAEGTLDAARGKPFYDGLKFHRVISKANGDDQDFMIQGGDPEGTGRGGPGYRFADEILEKHTFAKPGVLAMANAGPGTNGSQFFITIAPTTWLNGNHTIFGKVISGQEIVDTTKQGDVIEKITIVRQGADAQAFSATQADFDAAAKQANEAARAAKEKKYETQIKLIEKKWPGCEKDSNGIFYKLTKEGKGEICGAGKNVAVHYKGFLLNGDVFDQSEGRGPLEFATGAGQMIPGFDAMVQQMKVGEKRTILLPPDMHYGERGYPGVIPANSYIGFDIELISIK